jgi:hypothetical protein
MEEETQIKVTIDTKGKPLEGDKNYKLHLQANIPVRNFWSVIVYDSQTKLMIRSNQPWPSVHSNSKKLVVEQDGSIAIYFGSETPAAKECNWLQTIPGKSWYLILRLYGPMEAWFNKTWKCSGVEQLR